MPPGTMRVSMTQNSAGQAEQQRAQCYTQALCVLWQNAIAEGLPRALFDIVRGLGQLMRIGSDTRDVTFGSRSVVTK